MNRPRLTELQLLELLDVPIGGIVKTKLGTLRRDIITEQGIYSIQTFYIACNHNQYKNLIRAMKALRPHLTLKEIEAMDLPIRRV